MSIENNYRSRGGTKQSLYLLYICANSVSVKRVVNSDVFSLGRTECGNLARSLQRARPRRLRPHPAAAQSVQPPGPQSVPEYLRTGAGEGGHSLVSRGRRLHGESPREHPRADGGRPWSRKESAAASGVSSQHPRRVCVWQHGLGKWSDGDNVKRQSRRRGEFTRRQRTSPAWKPERWF